MAERARVALFALLIGVACDATSTDDGGAPRVDGGGDPPRLVVGIDGPDHAFVGEETCFSLRLGGLPPGAGVLTATWTWGDGEQSEGETACHAWALVGSPVLGVLVRAGALGAEDTHALRVVFRPEDPRPTSSSPLALDGDDLFVVSEDSDTLARISTSALALSAELPVGDRPRTVAVSGDRVAVACQGDGSIWLFERASGAPAGAVSLGAGSEPYGVIADPRGGGFFVSLRASGELVSLGLDGAVRDRLAVGPEPRGLAMNARGVLLATRWRAGAEGATVYTIDARDPDALALVGATVLPPQVGLDSDTDNDGVLSFLDSVVPSPDGNRALLPSLKANIVTGAHRTGAELTSQTTARAALAEVLFGAPDRAAAESFRHSFDDLDRASAAVFSPLGDRAYFAMQGAQTVVVTDAYDFFTVASIDAVGEAPNGLALSADGETLYVHAFLSRSIRVYDVGDLSREPPLLAEVPTVREEPLPALVLDGKRIFYRSRDPRMSRTRYLSCASCHLDGEGDSLVWDFTQRGEGLRNTIELRGHAGRAPLHWSANFDEVQDFEHDIRSGQGGTGFLADDVFHAAGRDAPLGAPKAGLSSELDALAAYVSSLATYGRSPDRRADPAWEASRARGQALFESSALGCPSCHGGPDYSDSAFDAGLTPRLHDVGTLGAGSGGRLGGPLPGLDTPTLRGLWRSAPYLHDGSAPTLLDVLTTANPLDRHGTTSGLDDAGRADLVTFLRSLDDG